MCLTEFSSSAFIYDTESNCSTEIKGEISIYSGVGDNNLVIGKIRAYYFDIEDTLNKSYDPLEVFDSITADITQYYEILYDDNNKFYKQGIVDIFKGEIFSPNLLVLDRIGIKPKFRGNNIGLAAIYRTIQQFGHGCGLIAMNPAPLQFCSRNFEDDWDKQMKYHELTKDEELARYKLKAYYQKLDFIPIENSEIFIFNPLVKLPDLDNVGYKCPCYDK